MNRSIPKAYLTVERREVTVEEYEKYVNSHPYRSSLVALQCIECGDAIIFAEGNKNIAHFKHSKGGNGHRYCSLYHEGVLSTSPVSKVWKKLRDERDLSFDFELLYRNNMWYGYVALPPFSEEELKLNEENNTFIKYFNGRLPINTETFYPGEVKRISVPLDRRKMKVNVSGKDYSEGIDYTLDLFDPTRQLFTTLISTSFSGDEDIVDLSGIKRLQFKRITGKVFVGKHYYCFCRTAFSKREVLSLSGQDVEVRAIKLKQNRIGQDDDFQLFDIVFKSINSITTRFANERDCDLCDRNDAVIVWPPINEIGNYKYFDGDNVIYVAFENDYQNIELVRYYSNRLFFRISNENSVSFYVTQANKKQYELEPFSDVTIYNKNDLPENQKVFQFKNNVLLGRISTEEVTDSKEYSELSIDSKINRMWLIHSKPQPVDERLMISIKHSRVFIPFGRKEYEYLITKDISKLAKEYIEMCMEVGCIKEEAFLILMGGDKNEDKRVKC